MILSSPFTSHSQASSQTIWELAWELQAVVGVPTDLRHSVVQLGHWGGGAFKCCVGTFKCFVTDYGLNSIGTFGGGVFNGIDNFFISCPPPSPRGRPKAGAKILRHANAIHFQVVRTTGRQPMSGHCERFDKPWSGPDEPQCSSRGPPAGTARAGLGHSSPDCGP